MEALAWIVVSGLAMSGIVPFCWIVAGFTTFFALEQEKSILKKATASFEQVRAEQLEYNAKREKGYRERSLTM